MLPDFPNPSISQTVPLSIESSVHFHTVSLVHTPKLKMSVALVGMIQLVRIGDFREERAGVLGEWMEEYSIHDDTDGLYELGQHGNDASSDQSTYVKGSSTEQQSQPEPEVSQIERHLLFTFIPRSFFG